MTISPDSLLIKRHKNPAGIIARVIIYPLIAIGLWEHHALTILTGLALEILNWTAMPPVEKTWRVIQQAIDVELGWLNAPRGRLKLVSWELLLLFPVILAVGFWTHAIPLVLAAVLFLFLFFGLMQWLGRGDQR